MATLVLIAFAVLTMSSLCVPPGVPGGKKTKVGVPNQWDRLVLRERIELSTSPLPRECSTTELPQPPMAGLLPYRTGKRKAKNNASVKAFAG